MGHQITIKFQSYDVGKCLQLVILKTVYYYALIFSPLKIAYIFQRFSLARTMHFFQKLIYLQLELSSL
jgi:hypothetical protein